MKTNFKTTKSKDQNSNENIIQNIDDHKKELSDEEFEEFITKSGAAGSFMVFRSTKKDDELGIDEL